MASRHIGSFLTKSWRQRCRAAQFYFRKGLAKLPFLPVPVRLQISGDKEIKLWWSQLVPFLPEDGGYFDYWATDAGDLRFLWRILQPGMVFIDIGAYHGIYSLVAGKKLGRAGTIISFEPSPREYRRLRMHLRLNRSTSARAEMLALGATTTRTAFFQVASGDTARNGLRAPAISDPINEIAVQETTLDEYLARQPIARVDIIKLDVEGGEMDVLRGATRVFQKFRPILICEVLDAATQVWGYDARRIISSLQELGYDWFEFMDDGSAVPHVMQNEYPQVKNYLAVPREKCSESLLRGPA